MLKTRSSGSPALLFILAAIVVLVIVVLFHAQLSALIGSATFSFVSFVANNPTGTNLTIATYTTAGSQPVRLDVYVCGEYNGGCLYQTATPWGWPGVYSSTNITAQNSNHTGGQHYVCQTTLRTITYYNNSPGYTGSSLPTVFSIDGSTPSAVQFHSGSTTTYDRTGNAWQNISATGALCHNIVFPAPITTSPNNYAPYTFSIDVVVNQSGFEHNSYFYDGIQSGTSPGIAIYDIGTLQVYPLATQTVSSTSTSTASTSSSSTTTITGIPVTSQGTTSMTTSTTTIAGGAPAPQPQGATQPWWEPIRSVWNSLLGWLVYWN